MALLASAGCMGGADPRPSPTDAAPATGAVEGVVLDDEGRPVAGAQVRALLRQTSTLTDDQGAYRLDNLTEGPLRLVASAQAHVSHTRDVHLAPGTVARVDFTLRRYPDLSPYHETKTHSVRIECGLPLGTSCEAATGANANQVRFDVDPDLAGIVVEAQWTAAAPALAARMRVDLRAATATACGIPYATATGESVLRLEATEGFPLHGGPQCLRLQLADDAAGANQDVDVFVTLFYHAPPPPGFTAARPA